MKSKITALVLAGASLMAQGQAMTAGEVRKVDAAQRKITLKHGEIKNLDLPAMSMAFAVHDASLLTRVQPGDKVRFTAEKIKGAYTLTAIEVIR
jgi:Cu/Ag efflux protein CusF